MVTVKEYEIKDLEKLLKKERTQILRLAKAENWAVRKVKEGRIYKNKYLASDIKAYLDRIKQEKKKENKDKKLVTRTVLKREATAVDELPEWNQRVANSRYILCIKLEEAYEEWAGSKEEIIRKFVDEIPAKYPQQYENIKSVSVSTLRRWYGIYKKNLDNPLALASGHGTNKGVRRVAPEVLELAKSLYFNKNKPKMTVVWEKVLETFGEKVIGYGTLRNYLNNDINIIEKDKARMGKKEFKDAHSPYIVRSYDDIKAGDIWMSDGHDLEMMCYRGNKKKANGERYFGSPKIIVWIDVKSRLITGWTLAWTETSEAIAIALKRGIEKYGMPKGLYTDNGAAYKSKVLKGSEELDGIYATLGLKVRHALPYNAQAKHIERWFVDFKESFTKDSLTYKGGNIVERPEHMKGFGMQKLSKGQLLEQEELERYIERWIEKKNHFYYALRRAAGLKAHRGRGMNNRTPLEIYNEECPEGNRQMISPDKLRLLFLYEELRTVQQNGIEYLGNTYIHDLLYYNQGERVKIKYDPHNLESIYVYLNTGEFLCKADKLQAAGWNDVTAIKEHKKRVKRIKKLEKEIIGVKEEIREETGVIDWAFNDNLVLEQNRNKLEHKEIEDAVVIDDKGKKQQVEVAPGVFIEINDMGGKNGY